MKKLRLSPEDATKLRSPKEVERIVKCFERRGIEATPQQAILLWERISNATYGVDWVKVPSNSEEIWQVLQGNRFLWQVEIDFSGAVANE